MRAVAIIPARMASSRFAGKPLAMIVGRPMLERVWETAKRAEHLDDVVVAHPAEDLAIAALCDRIGARRRESAAAHPNGTSRVAEAARFLEPAADVVVNIQGDEPLLEPADIDRLVAAFRDPAVRVASLYFKPEDAGFISDRNRVKVLVNAAGEAVLFSRTIHNASLWRVYGQHVGVYAFRAAALAELAALPPDPSLEQLAWIATGYKIRMIEVPHETAAVDCSEDVERVGRMLG